MKAWSFEPSPPPHTHTHIFTPLPSSPSPLRKPQGFPNIGLTTLAGSIPLEGRATTGRHFSPAVSPCIGPDSPEHVKHERQEVARDDGNDNGVRSINGITHALGGYISPDSCTLPDGHTRVWERTEAACLSHRVPYCANLWLGS